MLNIEHLVGFKNGVNGDIGAVFSSVFEEVPELVEIILGEFHIDGSEVNFVFVGFVQMLERLKYLIKLQKRVHNETISPVQHLLFLFLVLFHLQSLLPGLLNLVLNPFHLLNRQFLILHLPLQRNNLFVVHLIQPFLVLDSRTDLLELELELGVLVLDLEVLLGLAVEGLFEVFLLQLELFQTSL